jgi:murein DD-endopeptidase MepM/ murein hydrolase activator NlpD
MSRFSVFGATSSFFEELRLYFRFLYRYIRRRGYTWFAKFEAIKDVIVDLLYRRRGKYARPFLHFGTIALIFLVITFGPLILQQRQREEEQAGSSSVINLAQAYENDLSTSESELVRQFRGGEVYIHTVEDGETFSSIADKYGLKDINTILWENDLTKDTKLKPGQQLRILPVDGVRHKVQRGETIFSIAKKYGLEDEAEAQAIVNYPFNEFKNDETFDLTVGQTLMVPGGVKQSASTPIAGKSTFARQLTKDAGAVSATGSFAWPASGVITQRYSFYHKAWDIANRAGGPILAADSGTVIVAGWIDNSGYANRVMIDHGNGYVTLYAHLSVIQVQVGQHVARGNVLGQMGCTGRCTGTHLHFEIRHGGVIEDPGGYLK